MKLVQLLLFWLILKSLETSLHNAAEFVMMVTDQNQFF